MGASSVGRDGRWDRVGAALRPVLSDDTVLAASVVGLAALGPVMLLRGIRQLGASPRVRRMGRHLTLGGRLPVAAPAGLAVLLASCTNAPPVTSPSPSAPTATPIPLDVSSGNPARALQSAYVAVVQHMLPSVVQIKTDRGLGSGVVFDSKGNIVTNAHVAAGASSLEVTTYNGHSYPARLVGTFVPDDLALIHVDNASLTAAAFADSTKAQVGNIVLAIGNPLGLQSSVTAGIISAVGRTVSEGNGVTLPDTIQTSAEINPGNSGGALADLDGRVVGIPTLAASDPQLGGGAAPGIGFAIPSSLVTTIAGQIAGQGRVTNSHRAYLGITLASSFTGGAVISSVAPGSPAERAGLQPGDTISGIGGRTTETPESVTQALAELAPSSQAPITVQSQDGGQRTVSVTLGELPG